MNNLTLGSLFDGSGGFPLGAMLNGITPIWASEVEPFPIRVTTKRLPFMKHLGDICTINGAEIEPVDIITFGSPCTDMSVAGKRAGLDGKQSVLFYEAIRIVKEMRRATDGQYPRYIIWENVPGAFSSNKGEDFKAVLEAVIGIYKPQTEVPSPDKGKWPYADIYVGYGWSVAYRTIDAQYFGVAQRRRRIYLVADFGSERAGEILFEREGVSRDFTPCFIQGQGAARNAEESAGATSIVLNDQGGRRIDVSEDMTSTLRAEAHHPPCVMQSNGFCTEHSAKSRGVGFEEERSPTLRSGVVPGVAFESHPTDGRIKVSEDGLVQTLTSRMGTGGGNTPLVMDERLNGLPTSVNLAQTHLSTDYIGVQCVCEQTVYGICSDGSNSMKSDNPNSGIYEADTSRTLDQTGGNPACNQGGMAVVSIQGSMIGRTEENGPQGDGINEDVSFTLNTCDKHAVAYTMTTGSYSEVHEEMTATLMARDYKDVQIVNHPQFIVRRLTPTECAKLQGFPSDWCGNLEISEPTDEEIVWWSKVFETHRKITGTSSRPKSRAQIVKWLRNPHSDSAEYKLWGNGISLPCVCFVLMGIQAVKSSTYIAE